MPLPALFICTVLWVHDGDTMRCEGFERSARLYAIDAPEMPGACRSGRTCTPGDPNASRDNLVRLVTGKTVQCRVLNVDNYRRPVVQCVAGGRDLSCAQVAAGFAVERYGRLYCR